MVLRNILKERVMMKLKTRSRLLVAVMVVVTFLLLMLASGLVNHPGG